MAARRKWPLVLGAILGVLIVAVVVALFVLDSILTSQAHEQAQKLSKQLGRPVKIGSVATKLITGLGVRVSDISVGAGPGEKLPLAQVSRVEVQAALLKAVTSKFKEIEIRSAEVQGLTVNVIKLADGETNLEHLQEKLAEQKKPEEPKKEEKRPPADLSALRVDHLALREGTVRFLDESGGGSKQLQIQHLSVVVNDLRAGKPLDVVVKAAVLAAKENFELRLHASPLPPTLVPTPERVVLKIQPIELSPLAPFVPASIGLKGGHLDADFEATLGAAVPGGSGRTSVKGAVHALQLEFAGAEGGKPLDVVLDTDVDADAAKGDVALNKLRLDLGPAHITGTGKAFGLKSQAPRVEGLHVVAQDLDPAKLAALYPPLRKQLKGQISGPIGLTIRGSGTQAKQAVEIDVDLTPVRLEVPQQLTKAAGAKASLVAHVKGAAAANGELAFDAKLDLVGVDLRPGESLDKKPGDALDVSIEGVKSGGEKGAPTKVSLSSFTAHLEDATFTGKANVELAGEPPHQTTTFDASLKSPRVDVDKLLLPSKAKKEKPPPDPAVFAGLSGRAEVRIDQVIVKKQELRNVVAQVTLKDDLLTVQTAQMQAFGGKVSADGTTMRLAHPDEPFHAKVVLQDIDLDKGLALVSDKKVVSGHFNGNFALDGKGTEPELLKKTLAGLVQGKVMDGVFHGQDLVASIAGPLAGKLPFGVAGKAGQGGATSLGKELPFGLQIENGRANLKQPLAVASPQAVIKVDGGLTLDGNLDMAGNADLSPQLISAITAGKAKLDSPIPVKFKLGGPAFKPVITDVDLGSAVQVILKHAASGAIGGLIGGAAGQKAADIVSGGTDKAKEEAQKAAQAKADEARKEAEARAKAEADKQRKKLEDEAKNRLKGLFGN